jgi:alpha-D-ribose 1-methylphosphonate 5-triphosphate synthase subunit PhnG
MTTDLSRERRTELLAGASPTDVVALAERCVAHRAPSVVIGPDVGMVVLQVREPVAEERFHLGEILVTRAEVERLGVRGWSMRMGDDRLASLASAVLDTEVEADGPLAAEVQDLCRQVERNEAVAAAEEWAELVPTTVTFEELD